MEQPFDEKAVCDRSHGIKNHSSNKSEIGTNVDTRVSHRTYLTRNLLAFEFILIT